LIKPGLKLAIKNGRYRFIHPTSPLDIMHNEISLILNNYYLYTLLYLQRFARY